MPERPYVLFIDNHDSFTFNLVDAIAATGAECEVLRNDHRADEVVARAGEKGCRLIVISPGPGNPGDAGCCLDLVRGAAGHIPIFGVCLGHQTIVEAFGGEVGPAPSIVHGKASPIRHDGHPLFAGLPETLQVGRYHSLVATLVPEQLEVVARDGEMVMAVAHPDLPVYGVQFHPESILTASGPRILSNVLHLALQFDHSCTLHPAPCTRGSSLCIPA